MALRPGNYGESPRKPAPVQGLRDVNGFKGVVFKVNNNKPPSSARCRLLIFLKTKKPKTKTGLRPKTNPGRSADLTQPEPLPRAPTAST
jgi:hypothetical protein